LQYPAIINRYGIPTAQRKDEFLKTLNHIRQLAAVKQRRLLPLGYDKVTSSFLRAQATRKIVKPLDPLAFDLRNDGS
jgi:hypothetical protein